MRLCYWCSKEVKPGRRSRVVSVGSHRFHFHGGCKEKFMEANPTLWIQLLQEVAQRS